MEEFFICESFGELPGHLALKIFGMAVKDDPESFKALRLCNKDIKGCCRNNRVSQYAKFKEFAVSVVSMEEEEIVRLRKLASIGSSLAQLVIGAHEFFNENLYNARDLMLWRGFHREDHKARYVNCMMDAVRGYESAVYSFQELFTDEAAVNDRVKLRTSRIFFREIVRYESYNKFDFLKTRLCVERGGNHWDGHMESIYLLKENNIKCWKCGYDLELYKLRFGLL